ncbi:transcriptional regulator [Sphingobium sufflavum]|uniref:FadR/GntR family transcriptional regulator n=1 Tax=Sphingobium sufflavum TaxID=1129547 RepID=UPI001F48203B|nr:transcriptional regulator [Sphingobium sufflavum]MCE7796234.1 transcriptional regulator [Sphingobium sufflavum]
MDLEPQKKNLVSITADRLRDRVFAAEPDSLIGSLQDLARTLEVGIVTLQQAARILEHEGLLEGRRGPGGGFYGTRPGPAAVARSLGAYLRSHPSSYEEAVNITSLLFNELVPAAAECSDAAKREELVQLSATLPDCVTEQDCGAFEEKFQDLLFRMVDSPLFKLLTVVTLRVGVSKQARLMRGGGAAVSEWRGGRERIIAAILTGDRELARFEADRSNRRAVMNGLREAG